MAHWEWIDILDGYDIPICFFMEGLSMAWMIRGMIQITISWALNVQTQEQVNANPLAKYHIISLLIFAPILRFQCLSIDCWSCGKQGAAREIQQSISSRICICASKFSNSKLEIHLLLLWPVNIFHCYIYGLFIVVGHGWTTGAGCLRTSHPSCKKGYIFNVYNWIPSTLWICLLKKKPRI